MYAPISLSLSLSLSLSFSHGVIGRTSLPSSGFRRSCVFLFSSLLFSPISLYTGSIRRRSRGKTEVRDNPLKQTTRLLSACGCLSPRKHLETRPPGTLNNVTLTDNRMFWRPASCYRFPEGSTCQSKLSSSDDDYHRRRNLSLSLSPSRSRRRQSSHALRVLPLRTS